MRGITECEGARFLCRPGACPTAVRLSSEVQIVKHCCFLQSMSSRAVRARHRPPHAFPDAAPPARRAGIFPCREGARRLPYGATACARCSRGKDPGSVCCARRPGTQKLADWSVYLGPNVEPDSRGLVPGIQRSAGEEASLVAKWVVADCLSGARRSLDPGNECRDDKDWRCEPQVARRARANHVPRPRWRRLSPPPARRATLRLSRLATGRGWRHSLFTWPRPAPGRRANGSRSRRFDCDRSAERQ